MAKLVLFSAATVAAFAVATSASAVVLTFDGAACQDGVCNSNNELISQNYGDIAGQLDVQWDRDNDDTDGSETRLRYYGPNYSDLVSVGYGGDGNTDGPAEIYLMPLAGYQVTLVGFDLGAWPTSNRNTQVTILSGSGATLASTGPITVLGSVHSSFSYNFTRSDGIRIVWGPDNYDVGIDNLEFTVSQITAPIPEPGAWALMIGGFGAAGAMLRRRKTRAAIA